MGPTLLTIRIFFFLVVLAGSYLLCFTIPEWDEYRGLALFIGGSIGALVILVDILLRGFSLRGLSALTFGLFIGWLMAMFITNSPLFAYGDESTLYIARMALFIIMMYLGAVIALRGKDEFNLVIPYVRFVPQQVDAPLAVVDSSALIDGRVVDICRSKFMGYALVIPSFVVDELHRIADSGDPQRRERGRRGIDALNTLRRMTHIDLRIHQSEVGDREKIDAKIIFLAQSLRARILTTDYNLAQVAEFHNVEWLNLSALMKALRQDLIVGQELTVQLIKPGKERDQAVGYLEDGSMVVVNDGIDSIGKEIEVEIQSILPSSGGKMIFAQQIRHHR